MGFPPGQSAALDSILEPDSGVKTGSGPEDRRTEPGPDLSVCPAYPLFGKRSEAIHSVLFAFQRGRTV